MWVSKKQIPQAPLTALLQSYPQPIQRTPIVSQIPAPNNTQNEAPPRKNILFSMQRCIFLKKLGRVDTYRRRRGQFSISYIT